MKEKTIEVKVAFKGEEKLPAIISAIADAVEPFGYQGIEGIDSLEPGVQALVFEKQVVASPVEEKKKTIVEKVVEKESKGKKEKKSKTRK